jgi:hypothetical protein
METITEMRGNELVQEVEAAKGIYPDARVKVRRGRVIVLTDDLIMLEPFVWAFRNGMTDSAE